jgi:hypothetical protein
MAPQRFQLSSTPTDDGALALTTTQCHATILRCEELQFNIASHIVTPRGLGSILDAMKYSMIAPKEKLVVCCHTDTTDDAESNQALSERRAKMIVSLMTDDRAAFAELAVTKAYKDQSSWEKSQVADIIELFSTTDPVLADLKLAEGDSVPAATAALSTAYAVFHRAYNAATNNAAPFPNVPDAGLKVAQQDPWKWVHSVYTRYLRREIIEATMPVWPWVDTNNKAFGYGESYPIEAPGKDKFPSRKNRRADFVFFKEGEAPALPSGKEKATIEKLYMPSDPAEYILTTQGCRPRQERFERVFIVDRSGSMSGVSEALIEEDMAFVTDIVGTERVKRMDVLNAHLKRVIGSFTENYKFAIVGFSTGFIKHPATGTTLVKGDDAGRRDALKWIKDNMKPTGGTDLEVAIDEGLKYTGAREFAIFTDGEPTVTKGAWLIEYNSVYKENCRRRAHALEGGQCKLCYQTYLLMKVRRVRREKGIVVNVYGLVPLRAPSGPGTVQNFLKELARYGGGVYTQIGL